MANDDSRADPPPPPSTAPESNRNDELTRLLKRALEDETEAPSVDVLQGVQQKLHERSGGKFYADGWSTARHPPFATYFITSLMMLAIVVIIYSILTPLVGDPISVPAEPAPVRVLPPR